MWKHKKLGFTVTNVEFIHGFAKFVNNGIEDLEKAKHVIDVLITFEEKKMEVGDE